MTMLKGSIAACAVLVLSACAAPGLGGMNPMGGAVNAAMANSIATGQMSGNNLLAQQAAAEAAANRPGDSAMTCEAIQVEMDVMFNDPAFKANVAASGAAAQAQMDQAKSAQAGFAATTGAAMAAGVAGSFIPGVGGYAGMAAANAQMAAAMAQMPAANRNRDIMYANIGAMVPQMMRGQRLNELAQAKNCAFIKK
jgi:hypothetical protein